MTSEYCFVIPNYNHADVIESTIASLQSFQMPIILVDDGSNIATQQVLADIDDKFSNVVLIRREQNGGKGAAVDTGLKKAHQIGMTHALQVDADGQHNLADVEKLLAESRAFPDSLISGRPVYDESISKGRYYGRFITHFWVWIETLSLQIKDSMCGFRVYPLAAYVKLTDHVSLGQRMDYDIEVMVRLFWQGLTVRFITTKVHYPEGGISHFNALHDNWLISKMHSKLFFGMLVRSPSLLLRHFQR
ncbi:glycosyltransferase family 2 protein [Paraglaciecola aquimarina]|uniref:Glycosyltransferase family 2 protein n=1 Tax=Paraglaciecola aquimarina TaxID=1235557 RepID=A0ABU3SSQ3_9ALTE|nr:glycosyltransferase family 2 protein [Paraglaciecola aquimarina]MDU0353053.1 glycosyltransferase family 2 protein [Paraglaciecola aquimarina]